MYKDIVKSRKSPDYILLGWLGIIVFLGILVLASVSARYSSSFTMEHFGEVKPSYFLFHQIFNGFLPGLILAFLAFKIKLSFLNKYSSLFLLFNLILMGMVFIPRIGSSIGGSARWLIIGPLSFQPSEFLKLSFILYLSSWLAIRTKITNSAFSFTKNPTKERFSNITHTLVAFIIVIALISFFLICQPDISTLVMIILVSCILYFLANTPIWHSFLIFSMMIAGVLASIKFAPYRMNRFLVFLNPQIEPQGIGYQIRHALIAIGSGGVIGTGLGFSLQKFILPEVMSDSIFAVFAEETGFVGASLLVLFFLIFLWRGFKISKDSINRKDKFDYLLSFGITSWIVIQAFINMGAMMEILPLTGIPLPFISYGGSHVIVELIGVGILLNISSKK